MMGASVLGYISSSWPFYVICLYKSPTIVFIQSYLMLIYRVQLVFLILINHLLSVYCSTVTQADLIDIDSSLYPCSAYFPSFCLYAYILTLNATNAVMIFPANSSFIMPVNFLLFLIGSGLLSSFEYSLVSNFLSTSFAMSL